MPSPDSAARRRVMAVYLTQGSLGLLLMLWVTWRHHAEAVGVVHRLGPNAAVLMAVLVAFAAALQLLKFELTSVIAVILTNAVVMFRPQRAYGYSLSKIAKIDAIDISIYLVTVPFVVVLTLAYSALGWPAVLALAFSGVVVNLVARNLAITRSRSQQQLKRIASLTNVGKTISLRFDIDELLMAIYTECNKCVDCTLFTIALFDEQTNELAFELDVREGTQLPKERIPVGQGLNSWVIQ